MKIAIIGLGRLGAPLAKVLRDKGHTVYGYDQDEARSTHSLSLSMKESDLAIFCVPTPSSNDGSFSDAHLIAAMQACSRHLFKPYLFVVASTTTPGTCDRLHHRFSIPVVYKPEFIALGSVERDLLNPDFHLIGASDGDHGITAANLYRSVAMAPIQHMSLLEAELVKISVNRFLTMKISFANETGMAC